MIGSTAMGTMPVILRCGLHGALAGAALCAAAQLAPAAPAGQHAADFPSKPIRFIVPYPPAGTAGIQARAISDKLAEAWGQPVVIDHRPGGGGNIGAELAAKAPPDGYTIVMGTAQTHAINPSVFRKLPYDPVRDFAPVTLVSATPQVMVIHPSLPANSVREFVAVAKARPGQLAYASNGNGSTQHIAGEMFKSAAGINLIHVPYKGSAQAFTDLLSGQVAMMFNNLHQTLPHARAGRLRTLAVTSAKRSALAPDLPTVAESGIPGYEIGSWFAIYAPAGTPPAIVNKLHHAIANALASAEVRQQLAAQGGELLGGGPQALLELMRAEIPRYAKVVRETGARVD
jgi:tripartite-type tricarboxylate transporter receptor subunit TctC